jgi:CBS domain-containing protein
VADAATIMFERHANPLPVVENGKLVGTLIRTDILRLLLREDEPTTEQAAGA